MSCKRVSSPRKTTKSKTGKVALVTVERRDISRVTLANALANVMVRHIQEDLRIWQSDA